MQEVNNTLLRAYKCKNLHFYARKSVNSRNLMRFKVFYAGITPDPKSDWEG